MAEDSSKPKQNAPTLCCSFCGNAQEDVEHLIAGPQTFICNDCVDICNDVITDKRKRQAAENTNPASSPRSIREFLDEYVIGQDRAKRVLSVAVYNHYKRIKHGGVGADVELSKSNILLIGPTGTGKTLFAHSLARALDVPFTMADATTVTEAGYVGEDVDSIITKLLQAADYNVEKAQRGIIFIDEIDKIASRGASASITRDVSGEGVQQALLKIMEGTVCSVRGQVGRKNPQEQLIEVDTSNILFICGGAFPGLDKIISSRLDTKSIGFGASVGNSDTPKKAGDLFAKHQMDDLVTFGLIPEFVGRLPVIATLQDLDEEMLGQILTEPKNALVRQYEKMFEIEGIRLDITTDAISAIAKQAIARKTGARGLRTTLEELLIDTMYDLPDLEGIESILVDEDVVHGEKSPVHIAVADSGERTKIAA